MRKNKITVSIAAILSLGLCANAQTLSESLKTGKFEAEVGIHTEQVDGNSGDSGFSNGTLAARYQSGIYNGFGINFGFRANQKIDEENDGNFNGNHSDRAILSEANIAYGSDMIDVIVGRQEIDLEWIGDYHEGAVAVLKTIPDTTLIAGYTQRIGAAGEDEISYFEKIGDDGAYTVDLTYEGIADAVINLYYLNAPDIFAGYGIKADYDMKLGDNAVGVTGHYAATSEDTVPDDGNILHLEARGEFAGIGLSAGYIATDEDGGIGSLDALGDNINPLEEGNLVYAVDANTFYISAAYAFAGAEIGAMYGNTEYGNSEEKEINLTVDYEIAENLSISAVYADVSADSSADDYNKLKAYLSYAF